MKTKAVIKKNKDPKAKPKRSQKLVMASKVRSAFHDHHTNLESILGHSDHVKAIKDHNAGKHDHLSARMKGAAFHSAMAIHRHYKKHGKDQ